MANTQDKKFPVKRNATMGGVVLVDPDSGKPYKAGVTVQQVEGGFDPTGLSTEAKQNEIIAALDTLATALAPESSGPTEVTVTDDQLPPVEGQATATKQDQILSALSNLAGLLGGTLKVTSEGALAVSLASAPLPTGAATAGKQDDLLAAIAALEEATGTAGLASETTLESVLTGLLGTLSVSITNASVPVTIGNTVLPVEIEEPLSIIAAQPIPVSGSVGVTGVVPISDNGGSVTVDGSVAVSGAVQVEDNGKSLTVDGTVAATQSGAWNVGINGTVPVSIAAPVIVQDADGGPLGTNLVDGATGNPIISATAAPGTFDRGLVVRNIPSGTQTVTGNVTNTTANAGTLTTSPTAISVGTTSVSLAASVTGRKSVIIQNMGGTTLFLSFAATAVATAPTFQVPANSWIVIDRETWTGVITGIRASGSATADAVVTVTS